MFVFLILATLTGVRWNIKAVFICISLMTKDGEHFYKYFLAIWISSSENSLFSSVAHFNWVACLLAVWGFLFSVLCAFCWMYSWRRGSCSVGCLSTLSVFLWLYRNFFMSWVPFAPVDFVLWATKVLFRMPFTCAYMLKNTLLFSLVSGHQVLRCGPWHTWSLVGTEWEVRL